MHAYSEDAIRRGHIPTLSGFAEVIDEFRRTIGTHPAFLGGYFAGSVAGNNYTELSDVDGGGVYPDDKTAAAKAEIQRLRDFAAQRFVPVGDFVIDPLSLAQSPLHSFTPGYRRYLEKCIADHPNVAFGRYNALDFYAPHPDSEERSAIGYLSAKIRKIKRLQYSHDDRGAPDWYDLIEQLLSPPFYAGLRLLDITGYRFGRFEQVNAETIIEKLEHHSKQNNHCLEGYLGLLEQIRRLKTPLLYHFDGAREGQMRGYMQTLQEIADLGPVASELLIQLGQHIARVAYSNTTGQLLLIP